MSDATDPGPHSHESSDESPLSDRGFSRIHIGVLLVVAAAAFASLGTSPPMWSWSKSAEAEPRDVVVDPGYVAVYDVHVEFGWNTDESEGDGSLKVDGWYDQYQSDGVTAAVYSEDELVGSGIEFSSPDAASRVVRPVSLPAPQCDDTAESPCKQSLQVEVTNATDQPAQIGWTGIYQWTYTTYSEEEGEELEAPDGEIDMQIDFFSIQTIDDREQEREREEQNSPNHEEQNIVEDG